MTRRQWLTALGVSVVSFLLGRSLKNDDAVVAETLDPGSVVVTAFPRSFTATSYWNMPIPTNVLVDPRSNMWCAEQARLCPPPTVKAPGGSWSMPWSEVVTTGKLATIRDKTGKTVKVYIDVTIGAMTGDDAAAVFRDWRTGIEVSTFETVIPRLSTGLVNVAKPITCTGFATFKLSSNGIAKQSGGDAANTGHRGLPPSTSALHPSDTGVIAHRMKVSLGPPADHPGANWPMYGIESPRAGAIPEGAVIRRKVRDTSNAVRLAAHDFGLIIGDTAGNGKSALKTVQNGYYPSSTLLALDGLTWADWEVMTLGFKTS